MTEYKEALAKQIAAEICRAAKATIQAENWEFSSEEHSMPDWAATVLAASKMLIDAGFEMEASEIIAALVIAERSAPEEILKLPLMCEALKLLAGNGRKGLALADLFGQE